MSVTGTFTTNTAVVTGQEGAGLGEMPYVSLAAKGTWGGATVTLEAGFRFPIDGKPTAATVEWFPIPEAKLTADGVVTVAVSADNIRIVCTGGAAQSIKWAVL